MQKNMKSFNENTEKEFTEQTSTNANAVDYEELDGNIDVASRNPSNSDNDSDALAIDNFSDIGISLTNHDDDEFPTYIRNHLLQIIDCVVTFTENQLWIQNFPENRVNALTNVVAENGYDVIIYHINFFRNFHAPATIYILSLLTGEKIIMMISSANTIFSIIDSTSNAIQAESNLMDLFLAIIPSTDEARLQMPVPTEFSQILYTYNRWVRSIENHAFMAQAMLDGQNPNMLDLEAYEESVRLQHIHQYISNAEEDIVLFYQPCLEYRRNAIVNEGNYELDDDDSEASSIISMFELIDSDSGIESYIGPDQLSVDSNSLEEEIPIEIFEYVESEAE